MTKKRKPVKHVEPAEFVKQYYAKGRNATNAIKELDPELTQFSAENKGSRMLSNAKVQLLMQKVEQNLNIAALRGSKRLNQLIDSENEAIAERATRTALEYTKSKPATEVDVTTKRITISLSGELGKS